MNVEQSPGHRPPSGDQFAIGYADAQVQISQVGATLRDFTVGGRNVIDGFAIDERATDGRGQVLAPWPNRLTDGRYRYGDRDCQAPINEVGRHTAIHGLVRWLDWSLVTYDPASVTLSCAVRPQPGYEWQLDLQITYALSQDGLAVTCRAFNADREPAPFGARVPSLSHPWHGLRRRADADRAGHHLPPAGQCGGRPGHGPGHGDAAGLHPPPPDRVDTTRQRFRQPGPR